MQFESWSAALAMDGHGAYVWSIALVTLLIAAGLLLVPVLRSRKFMTEQRGLIRREAARQEESNNAPGA